MHCHNASIGHRMPTNLSGIMPNEDRDIEKMAQQSPEPNIPRPRRTSEKNSQLWQYSGTGTSLASNGTLSGMAAATTRVLIPSVQIQERVREMGAQIDADYPNEPIYLISILKGAFIFMADLARNIHRHSVRIEFMGISSYGKEKTSSGQVKVTRDLDVNIEGFHVLIVEDIIDSGVTLSYLTRLLEQRHPKSLEIATLLDKPERRIRPVDVKYVGFQIPDEFVVGYGLDYAEDYRNLSDICVLSPEG
jgi:hypoxanthine phosphoribosyltransferase